MSERLTRLNWNRNAEKAINGLMGILSGVTADRQLNETETLFLDTWLKSNQHLKNDADVIDLLDLIGSVLSDGIVTISELKDLNQLCEDILQYRQVSRFDEVEQINEFIGLLKGVTADGVVNEREFHFIHRWIQDNRKVTKVWPVDVVVERVKAILDDNKVTVSELEEFAELLKSLTGCRFDETGAADGSATEFLVNIPKDVDLSGRFCFTGTFVTGKRSKVESIAAGFGAEVKKGVSAKLDYLIVGSVATADWMFSSHGRKVEKALKLQKEGVPITILSEQCWLEILPERIF